LWHKACGVLFDPVPSWYPSYIDEAIGHGLPAMIDKDGRVVAKSRTALSGAERLEAERGLETFGGESNNAIALRPLCAEWTFYTDVPGRMAKIMEAFASHAVTDDPASWAQIERERAMRKVWQPVDETFNHVLGKARKQLGEQAQPAIDYLVQLEPAPGKLRDALHQLPDAAPTDASREAIRTFCSRIEPDLVKPVLNLI